MNDFIINDFIYITLEEGKTNIYVEGELFKQCKFLMTNVPIPEIKKLDEIDSIDEVTKMLGWTLDGQYIGEL